MFFFSKTLNSPFSIWIFSDFWFPKLDVSNMTVSQVCVVFFSLSNATLLKTVDREMTEKQTIDCYVDFFGNRKMTLFSKCHNSVRVCLFDLRIRLQRFSNTGYRMNILRVTFEFGPCDPATAGYSIQSWTLS